jgi:ethanolamine utilization protein EutJ
MNPRLADVLLAADKAIARSCVHPPGGQVRVGVDLGTAYTVLFVLDETGMPLVGAYEFAEVVRDGVVLDFVGASALVRRLKERVEERLGRELRSAATTYPPGVSPSEIRAPRYVLETAGLDCTAMVDEPTAANAVLQLRDGAVVDIGGGTTGIAIVEHGEVVYTADEPTGGTHFTLVIAGAHRISFEEAESLKLRPEKQPGLVPVVRPVMEKVASIIVRHLRGRHVPMIHLVGGTSAFPAIDEVIAAETGVRTTVPGNPLFVTPLGVALHDGASSPPGTGRPPSTTDRRQDDRQL